MQGTSHTVIVKIHSLHCHSTLYSIRCSVLLVSATPSAVVITGIKYLFFVYLIDFYFVFKVIMGIFVI